jgi:hypothetical protein
MASLHVDGVLGLVGQMRAPIFHFRDARVGIARMRPVIVRTFLRPLAIQLRQLLAGRCLDAALLRQPRQKLLVAFARIAPYDGP